MLDSPCSWCTYECEIFVCEYIINYYRCPQGSRSTLGGTKLKLPGVEKKEMQVEAMRVDGE